jgi:hypothetical protein
MVRQILIKRSQLQPAIKAAAAGGKMMATRMRQTSEALMDMLVTVQVKCGVVWSSGYNI